MGWYEANRARLVRRYCGRFVAVINKKVVDHDHGFAALAERVFKRHGVRSVFMPRVESQDAVVKVRSPRRVPP